MGKINYKSNKDVVLYCDIKKGRTMKIITPRRQPMYERIPSVCLIEKELKEAIRKVAYSLYEKNGRASGKDLSDWFEAEKIIKEELHPEIC